jgi:DNA-binding CsgD family transcriptional regulator/tetratricopeptide (TPR) repeat protein
MDQLLARSGPHSEQRSFFVGRAHERQILGDHLEAALAGKGRLVLISGEAGIGKTTLVRTLAHEAADAGVLVLTGHCYDLTTTPPYGPWLDLADRYVQTDNLPPLPAAFIGNGIEEIRSQSAFFAEVRAFLAAVAAECPTLLVLEDLHWADPSSLELLRYLAAHVQTMPILLLVTYRIDEPAERNPFYRQLPALIRDAEGLRLDLRRLDVDDLRAILGGRWRLPAPEENRLVDYLERHADGNPLFARELLRTLEEEGLLRQVGDDWELDEIDCIVLPPYLRQVIEGRVARLAEEMRQPLAMAAVVGQEVPLSLWARVTGLDEDALLAVIEQAVEAHLLDAEFVGARVRFVHALTREALYEAVLAPRRRVWHRQVGDALLETVSPDPDAVAYHFQQAGDPRAWEWLVRAGERAQRAYAWLTASARFAAAAELLKDVPGQERARGWLLYRCGRLQRYSQPALGIDDLAEAERLAHVVHDRALAADARYSRGLLQCYGDDFRLGLKDLAAGVTALEVLPTDEAFPSDTASAWFADSLPAREIVGNADFDSGAIQLSALGVNHRRGTLPWFFAAGGRLAEAQTIAEQFLTQVVRVAQAGELILSATGHAYQGLAIAHALLGRPDEARSAFVKAREVYDPLDHHAVIAFTLLSELEDIVLPYFPTNLVERRRVAVQAEEALQRAGGALPADLSPRRAWLGLLFLEGRWAEASAIAADTATHGNYYLRRQVQCVLAQLARSQGEPDRMRAHVHALLPEGSATEPGGCVFADGLFCQRLAADLELDQGNLAAARDWLVANDLWLAWNGSVFGRACNRNSWARFHRASGDIARARDCAQEALRAASQPDQPLARITAHRLIGELAGADRAAEAERHLTASLTLADACAAPYERALTLLALAELRAATGDLAQSQDLLTEVRAICAPLGARLTLNQADALEASFAEPRSIVPRGLTKREVEVLVLVAGSLTNAEVADRLSISERTVGQHLRAIYTKLDVTSRVGATRFALAHNLV